MKPVVPPRGCYRVQILVVGRSKPWRNAVSSEIRGVGYQVTTCDNARDALTVLVLGLPIDVMVIDVALHGEICGARLAAEARALRPSLRIVLTRSGPDETRAGDMAGLVPDAVTVADDSQGPSLVHTVRRVLHDARRPQQEN